MRRVASVPGDRSVLIAVKVAFLFSNHLSFSFRCMSFEGTKSVSFLCTPAAASVPWLCPRSGDAFEMYIQSLIGPAPRSCAKEDCLKYKTGSLFSVEPHLVLSSLCTGKHQTMVKINKHRNKSEWGRKKEVHIA